MSRLAVVQRAALGTAPRYEVRCWVASAPIFKQVPTRGNRATPLLMQESSLFERLGGEPALRAIIERFVDRLFDDLMIGYLFRAADRERVKAKEFEFAARHLGAPVSYTGRPIKEAHRAHRITGGQFMRRLQILKETLAAFRVPPEVSEAWIAHTLSLQAEITDNALDQCDPGPSNRSGSA